MQPRPQVRYSFTRASPELPATHTFSKRAQEPGSGFLSLGDLRTSSGGTARSVRTQ